MVDRRNFLKIGTAFTAGSLVPYHQLLSKVRLEGVMNVPRKVITNTTCNMCFLGCTVKATHEGKDILYLEGNPESPVNKGKLCAKGLSGFYKAIHPERLRHPLRRAGKRGEGKWEKISWDEAINEISKTLLEIKSDWGAKSLAMWQNINMDRPDIFKRFIYALGSPNWIGHQSTCDSSLHIGRGVTYGPGIVYEDYANSECIVLVGYNPLGARDLIHASREILHAKKNGAIIISIDPRMSETSMHASKGLWMPVKPGTDGILLAGMANYLIENGKYDHTFVENHTFGFNKLKNHLRKYTLEKVCKKTTISQEQFLKAVNCISEKKSIIDANRGAVTNKDATQTSRIVYIINALLGNIDRKGGLIPLNYPPIKLSPVFPEVPCPNETRIDGAIGEKIPLPFLKRHNFPLSFLGLSHKIPENIINEEPYPLKALIFNAINPVYSLPQGDLLVKAFEKLKLIVSIDAFMSETTSYADIVLPASTYMESTELWYSKGTKVSLRQPIIQPKYQSKPSQEIIIALAKKMGLKKQFPFDTYEDFIKLQLKDTNVSFEKLQDNAFVPLNIDEHVGQTLKNGFPTPSGKIELVSSVLSFSGFSDVPEFSLFDYEDNKTDYPFHLITYKLPFHTQSATSENPYLANILEYNPLIVNKSMAKKKGIQEGDIINITSKRGTIKAAVKLTEGIHPQVVALSHHFGHTAYSQKSLRKGVAGNSIISTETDPLGGNLTFNDTRVNLELGND